MWAHRYRLRQFPTMCPHPCQTILSSLWRPRAWSYLRSWLLWTVSLITIFLLNHATFKTQNELKIFTGITRSEAEGARPRSLKVEDISFAVYSRFGKLECRVNCTDWLISLSFSSTNECARLNGWSGSNWCTTEDPSVKRNCRRATLLFRATSAAFSCCLASSARAFSASLALSSSTFSWEYFFCLSSLQICNSKLNYQTWTEIDFCIEFLFRILVLKHVHVLAREKINFNSGFI